MIDKTEARRGVPVRVEHVSNEADELIASQNAT
jgi:hypothetical protein